MAKLRPIDLIFRVIDQARGPLGKIESRLAKVSKATKAVGRNVTRRLSAPIAAAGIAAGAMAAKFDDSLNKIVGLVGENRDQVNAWREDILALAPVVGKGPGELAEAMFFIRSAGIKGAAALDTLKQAARGSAAGLGDTATVADAATSAMNAYKSSNLQAGDSIGIITAAIREGKLEASTFAPVLGRVIPVAAKLGVEFHEVAAGVAAMTRLGSNAEESATQLNAVLLSILKPSQQTRKFLGQSGIDSLRKSLKDDGVLKTLERLDKAFGGNIDQMGKVFENARAIRGVFGLLGENAEANREIFQSLATAGVKDLDSAYAAASVGGTLAFRKSLAQLEVSAIRIGDAILPRVVPVLEKLTAIVQSATRWFTSLDESTQGWIVKIGLAAVVLGPLIVTLGVIGAVMSSIGGTALLIGGAIALFITQMVLMFNQFMDVVERAKAVWATFVNVIPFEGVRDFFGGGEAVGTSAQAARQSLSAGSRFASGGEQKVGGEITIRMPDLTGARVERIEAEGGIDLGVDTGLALAPGT